MIFEDVDDIVDEFLNVYVFAAYDIGVSIAEDIDEVKIIINDGEGETFGL